MSKDNRKTLPSKIKKLRDRPPRTKEHLDHYIQFFYGVHLASTPIEPGNSSPLDFVWDVFSSAMNFKNDNRYYFLGLATRGGQKSLSCAVLEMLLMQHDPYRDFFHMASIKQQAYATYDYFKKFYFKELMKDVLQTEPTMRESVSYHGTKLSIGTATMDSVNSFHGSTIQDELELTPEKIFNESKGMLSAQRGKLPLNICISSRKFGFGNIQKLIDQAAKDPSFPYKIHKWGILEVTEKCHESRNGGEFGQKIWVNDDDLLAVSEDQYNILSQLEKTKYSEKKGYKNCLSCGIFSFCQGRLPTQKENNVYLQPIDTVVSQFKTEDSEFFKSQRLNRKPSTKGLIYYSWDESIHVRSYAQMYEIFMGEPHPDTIKDSETGVAKRLEISFEELTNLFIKQGGRFVIGVDFGFSILAVAGLYYIDGADRIYFLDEIARQGFTEVEFAGEMKRNWGHLPIEMVYADPENPSGGKQIRQTCGWAVSKEVDKSVKEGIGTVRNKMRIPGTKDTMFFVSYVCTVFINEVKIYRNKINPVTQEPIEEVHKENDHSCDQVRYVIHSIFGKAQANYNDLTLADDPQAFNPNNTLRAPNAVELGTTLGIDISDNRDKMNKPQEEPKEEKISHGGAAFSWSW